MRFTNYNGVGGVQGCNRRAVNCRQDLAWLALSAGLGMACIVGMAWHDLHCRHGLAWLALSARLSKACICRQDLLHYTTTPRKNTTEKETAGLCLSKKKGERGRQFVGLTVKSVDYIFLFLCNRTVAVKLLSFFVLRFHHPRVQNLPASSFNAFSSPKR